MKVDTSNNTDISCYSFIFMTWGTLSVKIFYSLFVTSIIFLAKNMVLVPTNMPRFGFSPCIFFL